MTTLAGGSTQVRIQQPAQGSPTKFVVTARPAGAAGRRRQLLASVQSKETTGTAVEFILVPNVQYLFTVYGQHTTGAVVGHVLCACISPPLVLRLSAPRRPCRHPRKRGKDSL